MTWKLWNALCSPQLRHPILQEAQEYKKQKKPLARAWTWLFLGIVLLTAIFLFLFPIPSLLTILALIFAIPALMILFNGTVLGLYWVGEIAETIAREQRQGRFELLSLTPEGAVGTIWLLALGVIHRQNWLDTAYGILKKAALSILILLAASSVILLWGAFSAEISPERESQIRILREVIMIGFFVLALWLDQIQSVVLALMMGIFLPNYLREEGFLRFSASLLYLGLQVLIYLLILSIYQNLSFVAVNFVGDSFLANIGMALLSLTIFYLLREGLIGIFWRLHLRKYQAQAADYSEIFA